MRKALNGYSCLGAFRQLVRAEISREAPPKATKPLIGDMVLGVVGACRNVRAQSLIEPGFPDHGRREMEGPKVIKR
jgi:hypothetical protein